jgi:hypothetical protein
MVHCPSYLKLWILSFDLHLTLSASWWIITLLLYPCPSASASLIYLHSYSSVFWCGSPLQSGAWTLQESNNSSILFSVMLRSFCQPFLMRRYQTNREKKCQTRMKSDSPTEWWVIILELSPFCSQVTNTMAMRRNRQTTKKIGGIENYDLLSLGYMCFLSAYLHVIFVKYIVSR